MDAGHLDLNLLWQQCVEALSPSASSPTARIWLAGTKPVGFNDDVLVLAAPHAFARSYLDDQLGAELTALLSQRTGRDLQVVITIAPEQANLTDEPDTGDVQVAVTPPLADVTTPDPLALSPSSSHIAMRHEAAPAVAPPVAVDTARPAGPTVWLPAGGTPVEPSQLNPKYVFDHFVIGQSNRFAHAAAVAVAEAPAKSYNPFFVYGESGLGKTHLLHAIGHYVQDLYPRLKVRYITTEQFTNEFISAIQNKNQTLFQARYRDIDVLMVDDIQFLEGKEQTQEEFFHTFNALHNAEKQIVISSDRSPRKISQLEDRLRSRFEWGLIVDVQPPELETRIAILRRKADAEGLDLGPEILDFIGNTVRSNIRELEGALHRVAAFQSLQGTTADLTVAEQVLKDLFPQERGRDITCDLIMEVTAGFFKLNVEDLESKSRSRHLVNARQIAMYLVREMTEMSLPQIGKAFGGRDHTTVIHAKDKIATLMKEKHATYDDVQELTAEIRAAVRGAA